MLFGKNECFAYDVPVKYLGIEQGLSNNTATCIFRDHYGFMWIGTFNGLNRYDGTGFKIFENKWGDSSSLIHNHVTSIAEDHSNRIWIGTNKGLEVYDYANARISQVYYRPFYNSKLQKVNSKINTLGSDGNGNVYIATDESFLVCKNGSTICEQIDCLGKNEKYLVQTLTVDHSNHVWLFVKDVGLGLYNASTHGVKFINTQLTVVTCMAADQANKNLWMGSESGLFKYDIGQNVVKNMNGVYTLNNHSVMHIYPDPHTQLWIATYGGGVNIVNTISGKVTIIGAGESKGMLSNGNISAIYEDPDAMIWVATESGGVNIIGNNDHRFKTIANPQNGNSPADNFPRSFCEDINDNIWIGTAGGGLSYWNPHLNTHINFTHKEADQNSLSSDFVLSIVQDYQKDIWIATLKGGINLYRRQTHDFKHYHCYNSATHVEDPSIWKLYEDSHNNLWAAATRGGGLFRFNRKKDKFELYDNSLNDISALFEDRKGTLWMANSDLIKIDLLKKNHLHIPFNTTIHALYEDHEGNFWIGTDGGGLVLFNRKNYRITRFTKNNGIPGNTILNILEDDFGSIWFSTFNGLCKFNSVSKKFNDFFASDGLQSNEFIVNAALKLHTGELLFGGLKGFNKFFPDSIKTSFRIPHVYLTDFRVNNISIQEDSTFKGNRDIMNMTKITLDYNQAVIAVDYVAPEYSSADKINYAYFLDGWDHEWNTVGKIRTAYYSRLNEGNYILRIKSTNTDGVWANNQRLIYITVLPPWYRTWSAYLLYLCAVTGVVYLFWIYRAKQTRLQHEIEITNIRAEKERELNEKKLSFFTNISHEFKTPLMLIINPIKDILHTNAGSKNNDLNIIYRNARRLLSLVDHLLLFRKAESDCDDLKVAKLNLTLLAHDVYQCFISQAKAKNIVYTFNYDAEDIGLYADAEKIEIVLFNLISNAIKFTPDGGQIEVSLKHDVHKVWFEVSDSGCGIAAGAGEKLFEKYYQVKDKTSVKTGFGIGLYLVKTFIELHHGTVAYHNNSGGGASFILELKRGKSHFGEREIFEEKIFDDSYRHELFETDLGMTEEELAEKTPLNKLELLISDRQSVLIIDDNADLRNYIAQIFKKDYKIYEAGNGDQGLRYIKRYLPDIIISDINMGGLDGITLCRIIKQDSLLSHIPVILITGDATPALELEGIEVGAVDFISKPFEKDLLIARVHGVLRSKTELKNYFYNEVTLNSSPRRLSDEDRNFIYKCMAIIEHNIIEDDFDVQTIADEMGMSYSGLFKKVKLITGQSVNSFIRFIRIRKAAELLINTNCNVNEAAINVGISDVKYFREHFVKVFGIKPYEFLKKHRSAFNKNYRIEEPVRFGEEHLI